MKSKIILVLIFCVMGLSLSSCKTDINASGRPTVQNIEGEWTIYKATRNGKETKSLKNGNFIFNSDTTVVSNLFSNSEPQQFELKGKRLKIKNDPIIKTLQVDKIVPDTIILSSKMKVFDMVFYLKRNN